MNPGAASNPEISVWRYSPSKVVSVCARQEVASPATSERFEFRGKEVRCGHNPDLPIPKQLVRGRGFHSGAIPAIGESENFLIQGHDVEDLPGMNPPTQGCSFTGVFGESERS